MKAIFTPIVYLFLIACVSGCVSRQERDKIAWTNFLTKAQAPIDIKISSDISIAQRATAHCNQVFNKPADGSSIPFCLASQALSQVQMSMSCGPARWSLYATADRAGAIEVRGYIVDPAENGRRVRLVGNMSRLTGIIELKTESREASEDFEDNAHLGVRGNYRIARNQQGDGWMGTYRRTGSVYIWCTSKAARTEPVKLLPIVDSEIVLRALDLESNLEESGLWLYNVPVSKRQDYETSLRTGKRLESLGLKGAGQPFNVLLNAAVKHLVAAADLQPSASLDMYIANMIASLERHGMALEPNNYAVESSRLRARANPAITAANRVCSMADVRDIALRLLPIGRSGPSVAPVNLTTTDKPFGCKFTVRLEKGERIRFPDIPDTTLMSRQEREQAQAGFELGSAVALWDALRPNPEVHITLEVVPDGLGRFAIRYQTLNRTLATVKP